MNLKVIYGNCGVKFCVNIFKSLVRKEIFGVVLSDFLKNVGIIVIVFNNDSSLVCNVCYRKIKNLGEFF